MDDRTVYFTNPALHVVEAVSKAGGKTRQLAAGRDEPGSLAVSSARVYFTENDDHGRPGISSVSTHGGQVAAVARDLVDPRALSASGGALYWARGESVQAGTPGDVFTLSIAAEATVPASRCDAEEALASHAFPDAGLVAPCAASCSGVCAREVCVESVATSPHYVSALAGNSSDLLWIAATDEFAGDLILRAPLSGGAVETAVSGIAPLSLVVVADTLYFSDGKTRSVTSVPVAGGPTHVVITRDAYPDGLVADDTSLYWFENGEQQSSILKLPLAGGDAVVLASATTQVLALDAGHVYFADVRGGQIGSVAVDGGDVAILARADRLSKAVATDGANVYFATSPSPGDVDGFGMIDGALLSVPVAGGSPTTLISRLGQADQLVVHGDDVFFLSNSNEVASVPLTGGPMTAHLHDASSFTFIGDGLYVGTSDKALVRVPVKLP
jgi:hypothetical protein